MESDLDKMWESIAKPPQYTDSKLRDFFNVSVLGGCLERLQALLALN